MLSWRLRYPLVSQLSALTLLPFWQGREFFGGGRRLLLSHFVPASLRVSGFVTECLS